MYWDKNKLKKKKAYLNTFDVRKPLVVSFSLRSEELWSEDSTTLIGIWQFQTPAYKRYFQIHLLAEPFIFWEWWSKLSERATQDQCHLSTLICLPIYSLCLTQQLGGKSSAKNTTCYNFLLTSKTSLLSPRRPKKDAFFFCSVLFYFILFFFCVPSKCKFCFFLSVFYCVDIVSDFVHKSGTSRGTACTEARRHKSTSRLHHANNGVRWDE